jgi:tetratricopeptide (TPR) repeat protein
VRRIIILLAVLLGAPEAEAELVPRTPRCLETMSCIDPATWRSDPPPPMSIAASAAPAPEVCVKDILGNLEFADVPVCEAFASGTAGTPRQRAIAWLNLGHMYYYTKDRSGGVRKHAFAAWDEAIAADPTFAAPHVAKGSALGWSDDKPRAIPFFQKSLEIEPDNWHALLGLAKVLADDGKTDDALALAARAVAIAPDHGIAHQIHATVLEQAGRIEEARVEYRKATIGYRRMPRRLPGLMQEAPAWWALANFEDGQHRPQQAIDAISHELGRAFEGNIDGYTYAYRAKLYEVLGVPAKAAEDYEHAARLLDPANEQSELYKSRAAMLRAALGDGAAAGEVFRDIIRTGKLQAILRIQVFLRNQGFDEVVIDGKPGPALDKALDRCLTQKSCAGAPGEPI